MHASAPPPPRLPPAFARLAWSNLAAQSAEQIGLAAAALVAVVALGAGPGAAGLLQTAQTLPFLLLALPAGVLADRLSRRRLMLAAETLRALSLAAILALAAAGGLSLPALAALGLLGACGTVVYSVAAPALTPALVPAPMLAAANARLELARTLAFAAGPAAAGALVAGAGAPAFALATLLSAAAVALLVRLPEPTPPPRAPRHVLREIRDGAAFVLGHALLRPVLLTQAIFNAAFFMLQAVYAPYAVHRLGLSPLAVGATLAAYGAGMVGGALLAGRVLRALPFGAVVAIGPLAGVAAALAMVATLWAPSAALAGASFFLMGAGPILWVIATTTLRQAVTPLEMLGRASALFILAYGTRPLGAAAGAALGAAYGAEACIVAAALVFALQALVILASPVIRLARQPAPSALDAA